MLDLVGHARIRNDVVFGTDATKSARVIAVDGQPPQAEPLPSLADSAAHRPAWVSAGRHVFRIEISPLAHHPGVPPPLEYATFSATLQPGKDYLLVIANDEPELFEHRSGPGKNSQPPLNTPIPQF